MKGGLYSCLDMVVMVMAVTDMVVVALAEGSLCYSIVYFVSYHRCSLLVLKKKSPFKGFFQWQDGGFFTRCIAYFINHCRSGGLQVVYLNPLDLPPKNMVGFLIFWHYHKKEFKRRI